MVTQLLAAGAGASVNAQNINGDTPLHLAVYSNNTEMVTQLLAAGAGASVNVPDEDGYTPLHCAAYRGNAEMVMQLLEVGAAKSINVPNEDGHTPLHLAKGAVTSILKNIAACHERLEALITDLGDRPPTMLKQYVATIIAEGGIEHIPDNIKRGIINYCPSDSKEKKVHTALCEVLHTFPQCTAMFEERARRSETMAAEAMTVGAKVEEEPRRINDSGRASSLTEALLAGRRAAGDSSLRGRI
jgi:ankyrin repeat protein